MTWNRWPCAGGAVRPLRRILTWVLLCACAAALPACSDDEEIKQLSASLPVYAWFASPPSSLGKGAGVSIATNTTRFRPNRNLAILSIYYQYGSELVLYRQSDTSLVWSASVPNVSAPSDNWYVYHLPQPQIVAAGETYYIGVHSDGTYQWLGFPPTNFAHGTIDTTNSWTLAGPGYPLNPDANYLPWAYPLYRPLP